MDLSWINTALLGGLLATGIYTLYQLGTMFRWIRQDLSSVFAKVVDILGEVQRAAVNVTEGTQYAEDYAKEAPKIGLWGLLRGK